MTVQFVGNLVLVAAAIPAALFLAYYAARTRWEETQFGRQTMALSAVIALTLALLVVRNTFGDAPWYSVLRLVVFAMIVPTLWWRLYLLVKAQRAGRMGREHNRQREDA